MSSTQLTHRGYQVPEVKREFLDLKRFLAVNEAESQGEDS